MWLGTMGNSLSCCEGDNSREIKQVRQVAPAPQKPAFDSFSLHHSGSDSGVLRPLAGNVLGGGLRPSKVASTRTARPLPDHKGHHNQGGGVGDAGSSDDQSPLTTVIRPKSNTLISPRPRSATSSTGSSPSGLNPASFKPLGSGLGVNSAFSHSPASPFGRARREPKASLQRQMEQASSIPVPRGSGRTQSSFEDSGYNNNTDYTKVGGSGRTQSNYDTGSLYYEENILPGSGAQSAFSRPAVTKEYSQVRSQEEGQALETNNNQRTQPAYSDSNSQFNAAHLPIGSAII